MAWCAIYFQYAKYSVNLGGGNLRTFGIIRISGSQVHLAQPNYIWRFQNANVQSLLRYTFLTKLILYSRYINSLYHKAYYLACTFFDEPYEKCRVLLPWLPPQVNASIR